MIVITGVSVLILLAGIFGVHGADNTEAARFEVCVICIEVSKEGNQLATYDRAWLRKQVRSFLHDQTVSEADIDVFIDLGAMRIGQKLQSFENQETVQWSISTDLALLPEDFVRIRTIRVPRDNGLFALHSLPSHQIENMSDRSGGAPYYYALRGGKIAVRPFQSNTYELTYWTRTDIAEDELATNDALTKHPSVFLNAALAAAYMWKQDEGMMQATQAEWLAEVKEINRIAARADGGDAPAARAM